MFRHTRDLLANGRHHRTALDNVFSFSGPDSRAKLLPAAAPTGAPAQPPAEFLLDWGPAATTLELGARPYSRLDWHTRTLTRLQPQKRRAHAFQGTWRTTAPQPMSHGSCARA